MTGDNATAPDLKLAGSDTVHEQLPEVLPAGLMTHAVFQQLQLQLLPFQVKRTLCFSIFFCVFSFNRIYVSFEMLIILRLKASKCFVCCAMMRGHDVLCLCSAALSKHGACN